MHECVCPKSGHCKLHARIKGAREFQICKGENVSLDVQATYLRRWVRESKSGGATSSTVSRVLSNTPNYLVPRPGTELKALLEWFGTTASCKCTDRARLMDSKGITWCEENVEQIVGWLMEEASKRPILSTVSEYLVGFEAVARKAVTTAISRAKSKASLAYFKEEHLKVFRKKFKLVGVPIDKSKEVRHLLWHFTPWTGPSEWVLQKYIKLLREQAPNFNGRKIVTIITDDFLGNREYSPPERIQDLLGSEFEYRIIQNVPDLREALTLPTMLEDVMTDDPNHIAFFGHNKGISHPPAGTVLHLWGDAMIETVLRNAQSAAIPALDTHGVSGAFKRYGMFRTQGNHYWHYSGTFWWVRLADVQKRVWQYIDQQFFGAESWPATQFKQEEAACIFWDNAGDMYKETHAKYNEELAKWRAKYL